ncbi:MULTISPECIES: ROK family protein [Derxia]|uniref:fructokinase n=1 Tax=Derxia gummosa DSM 723 TaxID=1121388 RepID=A0A8B6XAQ8_9BURK|nr:MULTISPECIES: ROK family protein [Derxia]
MPPPLLAALEAGGTKLLCAIGTADDAAAPRFLSRASFPTGDSPALALGAVADWFRAQQAAFGPIAALGIASFGPVDLDPASPGWGRITATPKPGWRDADVAGVLRAALPGIPLGFDTDVNGAALGEQRWGAARGLAEFVYITMGTGIGAGGMAGGRLLHGLVHPEMGHMRLPRLAGDGFAGVCSFHGDCWEGLCSGPAIAARTGRPADELPADHPVWALLADTTALAIGNLVCVLSPRRVILGGSVRKAGGLGEAAFFARVRATLRERLAGYIAHPALADGIGEYMVPPLLGDDAGLAGTLVLAEQALAAARTAVAGLAPVPPLCAPSSLSATP